MTTSTSSLGGYQLSLQPATYNLIVSAPGYNTDFVGGVVVVDSGQTTANLALQQIPAYTSMDLFSRPDQAGVGTASDGSTWFDDRSTYPNGTQSITARQLSVKTATAFTDLDQWMGASYTDEEVTLDLSMVRGNGRVLARVQNATTWVEFAFNVDTSQLVLWSQTPGNNWNAFATVNNFVLQQSTWYHTKVDVIGNTTSAKIWAFGTAEPGWQVSGTSNAVSGPGMGGIRTAVADTLYANFSVKAITRVIGSVVDVGTGLPISGAVVQLSNGAGTTTAANGSYVFANVAPGTYTVSVSPPGYTGSSQSVSMSVGTDGVATFGLVSTNPPPPPPSPSPSPSPSPGPSPSPTASPSPGG